MATNASNVTTGKPNIGGAVHWASAGTDIPTDATTALASTFVDLGYVSEDGVTNSNSMNVETSKAWGGDVVLTYQKERPDTFKTKLIEAKNVNVLKRIYGAANVNVETGGAISVTVNNKEVESGVWVFDIILKGGMLKRVVIPNGSISALGDIVYKDNDAIGYDITITAVSDSDGNAHYEYMDTPATSGNQD